MRQVVQEWKAGATRLLEVPAPPVRPGCVLVETRRSIVSVGTERKIVEFSKMSLLQEAHSRPDLVARTIESVRTRGILATLAVIRNRTERLVPLGYSSAGLVSKIGEGVINIEPGDRVACAGVGYAVHAELACVPRNLVVKIPGTVSFDEAAFTTLGAVALQGIRLTEARLGETVGVIGLGLLGQLAVQMLKAAGCIVVGMDLSPDRARLAEDMGADSVATTAEEFEERLKQCSEGVGADSVLITAAAESNEPIRVAGVVARDRAIVSVVGAVGMSVPRKLYFEKELTLRVSRSYGPGRYDPSYEEGGNDYPIGYVRWTENRNMQGFLKMVQEGKVRVDSLVSHRFPFGEALQAYQLIAGNAKEPCLGVLLEYEDGVGRSAQVQVPAFDRRVTHSTDSSAQYPDTVSIGLIGAGGFANATLLPAMRRVSGLQFRGVASGTGISARRTAGKFGFDYCTADYQQILDDPDVNTVVITTRHHLHAKLVIASLKAGKHVFVEKPLAVTQEELDEIVAVYKQHGADKLLMVGFNRRFAPLAVRAREFFQSIQEPLMLQYRINAGFIPSEHWTQSVREGGGRIIGEACHFIDFATWIMGELPVETQARYLPNSGRYNRDNVSITIGYPGGSTAVIQYIANGSRGLGKERIEIHGGGRSAVLEDFSRLQLFYQGYRRTFRHWFRSDKGHQGEWEAIAKAICDGGPEPVPFQELVAVTQKTLAVASSDIV